MNRFLGGLIVFSALFLSGQTTYGQQGAGGTNSLFNQAGVGARALALGKAYVAMAPNGPNGPSDPTVVYWNPAGLDYLEKKGANFFYSNLIAGSSYNYVGFVYPTISIGSFGFGWIRIGTDDIIARDEKAVPGDNLGFSHQLFLFSYAKKLTDNLALGISLKLERFNLNVSDTGFGGDLGLLYRPDFETSILRDLTFGLNIQNIARPSLRLVNESIPSPRNIKFGFAKPIYMAEERNAFTLLFDVNKSENSSATIHFGSEYSLNNQAMVRFGINNGQIAFGAGASFHNIQLDYSFGKLFEGPDFSGSHRFSVTIEFGKGKTELIKIARERQQRERQIEVENRIWFSRELEFNSNMEEGREKFYNGDYRGAYVNFSSAFDAATAMVETAMRLRSADGNNLEIGSRIEAANSALDEARTMLEQADTKYEAQRREELKKIALEAQQSTLEQELQNFILEHRDKGNAFFKGGDFTKAISEWQLALDRILANKDKNLPKWVEEVKQQLENDIRTSEQQMQGNIKEMIKRADALARRSDYVQALAVLNDLIASGISGKERGTVESRIRAYQKQLNFEQNYDEGLRYYVNKDYKKAMAYFERALKIKPKDSQALKYFEDASDRALATIQEMPADIRAKFIRGNQLYRQGRYREALEIWEEIRKEEGQRRNKLILDAIDAARERLRERR
jgi:tetratricopeptide (TPR) repeat protein